MQKCAKFAGADTLKGSYMYIEEALTGSFSA